MASCTKHSSGDLHSRLKTRKILGVGETDNGDIHRSKISQVLGHNEHLYVKFPRGYWLWHLSLAVLFTALGLMNLLLPDQWYDITLEHREVADPQAVLATRFYGSTLLGMALLLWSFWGTTDKGLARGLMAAIAVCYGLQLLAMAARVWQDGEWSYQGAVIAVLRVVMVAMNLYFYITIGSSTAGLRKSASFKDLREASGSIHKSHSPESKIPPVSASPICSSASTPPYSTGSSKKTE